ncbi:MAG: RNA methyltransferase [Bacteroidetes bacterium]|nr:RNA methyltransferase [Bacteroidota bacterium]
MRKLRNEELNRLSVKDFHEAEKVPIIIILDNIRSLNNIGSVFRTADSFLIEAIYLCGITAKPPHREIHKTALGATESVQWSYFESALDAVKKCKNKGFRIALIEQVENSLLLDDFNVEKDMKYALVFGNEIKGVSEAILDYADLFIEIPQFGTKHSLNVSVSAGIVLWHFYYKRQNKKAAR